MRFLRSVILLLTGLPGNGGRRREHRRSHMGKCLQYAASGEWASWGSAAHKVLPLGPAVTSLHFGLLTMKCCFLKLFNWRAAGHQRRRAPTSVYSCQRVLKHNRWHATENKLTCKNKLTQNHRKTFLALVVVRAGLLSAAPAVKSSAPTRDAWKQLTTWCCVASPTCVWSVETAVWREPTSSGRNGAACWGSWWSKVLWEKSPPFYPEFIFLI